MKTEDLINKLARDAKPTRTLSPLSSRLFLWVFVALVSIGIGVAIFGMRPDLTQKLGTSNFMLENAAILIIALCAAFGALVLSVPVGERKTRIKWLPAIGVVIWFGILVSKLFTSQIFHLDCGFSCIRDIALLGFIPGALLFYMVKKGASTHPGAAGFLAVLAATSFGSLGVQFLCKNDEAIHVLLWHLTPALLLGFIGYALSRPLLRW